MPIQNSHKRWLAIVLATLCLLQYQQTSAQAQEQYFPASGDLPEQKQALLTFLQAVGSASDIAFANSSLTGLGYPGTNAWNTAGVSYCLWWGVTCCGPALTQDLQICEGGNLSPQSVSAIELPAVGLQGTLPDIFTQLPDLQVLDLSYNRGLRGTLPSSLGELPFFWQLNIEGTEMHCNATTELPAPCPLPEWLQQQQGSYYYDHSGLECPVITFTRSRDKAEKLARVYRGAATPEVIISDLYYNRTDCWPSVPGQPGRLSDNEPGNLSQAVLVIVILVPSLAVSVGLVLLSVALMRYLRYLKRSHDAIHLTEAWKRRNAPGIISDGNDRVLREVTLVVTDVEGSTELWEWDYAVMTLAQEIHDSVMRSLIGRYCGYEVTTEGDSFTVAFHDAFDAVCWSLAMQQAMLEAEWPEELLRHEKAGVVYSSSSDSSRPGQLLFRGLRVRVAISTGIPSMVYAHELTNTLMYAGPVTDLVTALSDLPAGGQVLLGPQSFSSIASRLAELGVRLMLTEGEAAASAASNKQQQQQQQDNLLTNGPSQDQDTASPTTVHEGAAAAAAALQGDDPALHVFLEEKTVAGDTSIRGGGSQAPHSSSAPSLQHAMLTGCNTSSTGGGSAAVPAAAAAGGGGWLRWWRTSATQRRAPTHSVSSGMHASGAMFRFESDAAARAMMGRSSMDHEGLDLEAAAAAEGRNSGPVSSAARPFHVNHSPAAAAAAAIQDNEHIPMIIDLGSHWLDGLGSTVLPGQPALALQGVRLTQIVTRRLAPRAAHFPAINTPRQVYPSYFQAPSASKALLPDGLVFKANLLPVVTMAFCAPEGMRTLEASGGRAAKQALEMFCSAVRTTLSACRGYECQEKDGIFMLAFDQTAAALEWACLLHLALMCVHWAPEVLASPVGREVYGENGELLYRGIRARIGIYKGDITRIIPHRATGRADYFGPPVNRAARFLAASAPGQILAEKGLVEECVSAWNSREQQAALELRALQAQAGFNDSMNSRTSGIGSKHSAIAAAADAAVAAADAAAATAAAAGIQGSSRSPREPQKPVQAQQQQQQQQLSGTVRDPSDGVATGLIQQQQQQQCAGHDSSSSFSFGRQSRLSADGRQESCALIPCPQQQQQQQRDPAAAAATTGGAFAAAAGVPVSPGSSAEPLQGVHGFTRLPTLSLTLSAASAGSTSSTGRRQSGDGGVLQLGSTADGCDGTTGAVQAVPEQLADGSATAAAAAAGSRSTGGSAAALPTLYEGPEQRQNQQQQQQQQQQDEALGTAASAANVADVAAAVGPPTAIAVAIRSSGSGGNNMAAAAADQLAAAAGTQAVQQLQRESRANPSSSRRAPLAHSDPLAQELYAGFDDASSAGGLTDYEDYGDDVITPAMTNHHHQQQQQQQERVGPGSRLRSFLMRTSSLKHAAASREVSVVSGPSAVGNTNSSGWGAAAAATDVEMSVVSPSAAEDDARPHNSGTHKSHRSATATLFSNILQNFKPGETAASTGSGPLPHRSPGSTLGDERYDNILYSGWERAAPSSAGGSTPVSPWSPPAAARHRSTNGGSSSSNKGGSSSAGKTRRPSWPAWSQQQQQQVAVLRQPRGPSFTVAARHWSASEQQQLQQLLMTSSLICHDCQQQQQQGPAGSTGTAAVCEQQQMMAALPDTPAPAAVLSGNIPPPGAGAAAAGVVDGGGSSSVTFPPLSGGHVGQQQGSTGGQQQGSTGGQLSGGGGGTLGEGLTGALPLEALPALRLNKMNKHQSFILQAIKEQQVHRSIAPARVPLHIQVHDQGTWTFKGISGAHPVVLLVPSRLAGRLQHTPGQKSSKAVCVQPAQGLLHELWLEVVNLDTILLDPGVVMTGSGAGGTAHPNAVQGKDSTGGYGLAGGGVGIGGHSPRSVTAAASSGGGMQAAAGAASGVPQAWQQQQQQHGHHGSYGSESLGSFRDPVGPASSVLGPTGGY